MPNKTHFIEKLISEKKSICIIGLGYVGLPLLISFSRHVHVIGYDVDIERIKELKQAVDRNGTYSQADFTDVNCTFTADESKTKDAVIYIVAVPTPITKHNTPDLGPLKSASTMVGRQIDKGDLVIIESTVFPGCTEDICIPIIENNSQLKASSDFQIGYSPERINPGDSDRRIDNTIKIVSGIDANSLEMTAALYEIIISAGVHRAPTIKVAESAKLVENVQRDVNIALMNEFSLIFDRLNINTLDVLDAAETKWNFQKYYPGLVGGHCISVDPYYLTYKAEEVGYFPEVILSGRKVNDSISKNVTHKAVQMISSQHVKLAEARVLVMGLTFKENIRDTRNSKVFDLIHDLQSYHIDVDVLDPHVSTDEINRADDINLIEKADPKYHCVILAVKHDEFVGLSPADLHALTFDGAGIIDIKGLFRHVELDRTYWTL